MAAAMPRRRLIRPAPVPVLDPQRHRKAQRLRERLDHERAALARWQTRLKRAFTTVEKSQRKIARMERTLAHLEE